MIEFVFFVLATIGLTNILVHGRILDVIRLRPLLQRFLPAGVYSVFECYECMGFWAGMIIGIVLFPPYLFFVYGFAGSFIAQTASDLVFWLRSVTNLEKIVDEE